MRTFFFIFLHLNALALSVNVENFRKKIHDFFRRCYTLEASSGLFYEPQMAMKAAAVDAIKM